MGEGTTKLPPGFHFFPSDEELVVHFLHRKAAHLPCRPDIIPTIDLHYCDPWDLNGKALQGGNYWYFFTQRSQTRETANGHWKPIGLEESITSSDHGDVGLKKTLIFYVGEPPEGMKTNWIMHEYHLLDGALSNASSSGGSSRRSQKKRTSSPRIESNKWVICRVYESSCDSQSFQEEGMELSCLDEVFLSLDDLDEVSLPD